MSFNGIVKLLKSITHWFWETAWSLIGFIGGNICESCKEDELLKSKKNLENKILELLPTQKKRTWTVVCLWIVVAILFLRGGENCHVKDFGEAVKWYRKAAEQGDAQAQRNLGLCYYYGEGVAKDFGEAVKWLRRGAGQGDAQAQRLLGVCYEYGNGIEKNLAEAACWYRKAADQGDAQSQLHF